MPLSTVSPTTTSNTPTNTNTSHQCICITSLLLSSSPHVMTRPANRERGAAVLAILHQDLGIRSVRACATDLRDGSTLTRFGGFRSGVVASIMPRRTARNGHPWCRLRHPASLERTSPSSPKQALRHRACFPGKGGPSGCSIVANARCRNGRSSTVMLVAAASLLLRETGQQAADDGRGASSSPRS
jgi:hypothetical protein